MTIKQLKKLTSAQLLELEKHEKEIFGFSGLNRWLLPVVARYGYLYVLLIDGTISGCASFIVKKDIAFLVGLWIKNKFRKSGFGEKLLKYAGADLKKSCIKNIELTVQEGNLAALKLYQKVGFNLVKKIDDFYGPNQPRLLLRCNLLE